MLQGKWGFSSSSGCLFLPVFLWLLLHAWPVVWVCEDTWWCSVPGPHPEMKPLCGLAGTAGPLTTPLLPTLTTSMHPPARLGLPLPRSGSHTLQVWTPHTPVLMLPSDSPAFLKATSCLPNNVDRSGWDHSMGGLQPYLPPMRSES